MVKIIKIEQVISLKRSFEPLGELLIGRKNDFLLKLTNDFLVSVFFGDHVIPVDPSFHEIPQFLEQVIVEKLIYPGLEFMLVLR